MRAAVMSALFAALATGGMAQSHEDLSHEDLSHFEVAAVKPAAPLEAPPGAVAAPTIKGGLGTSDPGQIAYRGIWLPTLIYAAYSVRSFQVSGPSWLASERYDIIAKIPPGATPEQFKVMLQNLLIERFNLSLHHESRVFPVYALVVGRNGPKLKEAAKDADPPVQPRAGEYADENGFPVLPPGMSGVVGRPSSGRMHLTGVRVGLDKLTPWLENQLDHPIVDETGLKGEYDFKLEFEWSGRPGAAVDSAADPAPSVFSVVEKDLGLKLEAKKVPFDVLVIDHLDKAPTAN
jgi:uncharacterized protein (TIGR03435 family)